MTNSKPKLNSKVTRQRSPNTGGKRNNHAGNNGNGGVNANNGYHQWNNKSSTYFPSGGRNKSCGSNGRVNGSPSAPRNIPKKSPQRFHYESPRVSPTNTYYAGAKFSEPPSPASLPKPPVHWTGPLETCRQQSVSFDMSDHLKMILNIKA